MLLNSDLIICLFAAGGSTPSVFVSPLSEESNPVSSKDAG